MNRQSSRGQAMAEFVVMTAGCVLLLFVLVPFVAKMSDMAYKSQETARYTAWERTVWYSPTGGKDTNPSQIDTKDGYLATRSDAEIFNTAERRLMPFSSELQAFTAQDITRDNQSSNNFWRWTHGDQKQSMVGSGQMQENSKLHHERTPSTAYSILDTYNDVMGGIAKVVSIFTSFGQGDEDLLQVAHPMHNFYSSNVSIPVSMNGSQLGNTPLLPSSISELNVGARSAILADGWVAQSEGHFYEKSNDFVIGTLVEKNPVWNIVRGIIGIFEPSFKDIDFSPVNTDPMPDSEYDCNITTGFCYFKK